MQRILVLRSKLLRRVATVRALVLLGLVLALIPVGRACADEMIANDKPDVATRSAEGRLEIYVKRMAQLTLKQEGASITVSIIGGGLWARWEDRELKAQKGVFWQSEFTREDQTWFRLEAYVEGNVLLILGTTAIRSEMDFLVWESDYLPTISASTKEAIQGDALPQTPLYEQALKARQQYWRKQKSAPENLPASDAGYPSSASVEVPVKIEVAPRHKAGFNLRSSEVGGLRVSVCTGGVRIRVADTRLAADSIVIWQPLAAEKKTKPPLCTPRSMPRVT